jgi:hypothetical protein
MYTHWDFPGYSKCGNNILWLFFYRRNTYLRYYIEHKHYIIINSIQSMISKKSWTYHFPKKKENNSVYYFRERISLYSCDIVERWTNLMISTSHGLLNLQATIPSAISRFVMLLLCQFPSLSVHDSAVRTKYLYLKFTWKEIKKKAKCILICCFIAEPSNWHDNFNFRHSYFFNLVYAKYYFV